MLKQFLHGLVTVAGSLLALGLVVGGMVLMVNPPAGRQLLKNLAVAALLFVLGALLLNLCVEALR